MKNEKIKVTVDSVTAATIVPLVDGVFQLESTPIAGMFAADEGDKLRLTIYALERGVSLNDPDIEGKGDVITLFLSKAAAIELATTLSKLAAAEHSNHE